MSAYYNENDAKAASWLRELVKQGLIAPGDVDERSIEDVRPDDLRPYTQCHFFAGIGVWSYVLRSAGWPDDRPVWTGSCPCQPFSAAGKGNGFADERHLWPAWHWLIQQCKPPTVFGEQVASTDGLNWLDLVQADLEGAGYAVGAGDLCAAGIGAPHIRQRLYFVADAPGGRQQGQGRRSAAQDERIAERGIAGLVADASVLGRERWRAGEAGDLSGAQRRPDGLRDAGRLADADGRDACAERQQRSGQQRFEPQDGGSGRLGKPMHSERRPQHGHREDGPDRAHDRRQEAHGVAGASGEVCGLADATGGGCGEQRHKAQQGRSGHVDGGQPNMRSGPVNGFWRDADWLGCTDGKWRPVEPGTFPLAHGAPARVGRLRGYGNAIVAPLATAFIEAFLHTENPDDIFA